MWYRKRNCKGVFEELPVYVSESSSNCSNSWCRTQRFTSRRATLRRRMKRSQSLRKRPESEPSSCSSISRISLQFVSRHKSSFRMFVPIYCCCFSSRLTKPAYSEMRVNCMSLSITRESRVVVAENILHGGSLIRVTLITVVLCLHH